MDVTVLTSLLASHTDEWNHGWWPLWPLLWIVVLATIVWVVTRRRWGGDGSRGGGGGERARDILAERYARGEIASDEYRERLEQLR
jgi:putative membrane protein